MLDAYVVGHGIPELAAALELAEVGLRVRVAPRSGVSQPATIGQEAAANDSREATVPPNLEAGVPDHDGHIRALLAHLAAPLGASSEPASGGSAADVLAQAGAETGRARNDDLEPVLSVPGRTLLTGPRGQWLPLPEPNIWGIPAVPMARDSAALLGSRGALRATVDRVRPVLTIGQTHKLGALVRTRMGQQTLDRLVNPVVQERFGRPAQEVDVAIAAPGLNGALTTAGSLSGAVLTETEEYVARETLVRPAGGWEALRSSLLERLALYNVQFGDEVEAVQELQATPNTSAKNTTPHWHVRERSGAAFDSVALVLGVGDNRDVPAIAGEPSGTASLWRPVLSTVVAERELPAELVSAVRAATRQGVEAAGSETMPASAISVLEASGWTARFTPTHADQWLLRVAGPVAEDTDDGTAVADETAAVPSEVLQSLAAELPAITGAARSWELAPVATTAGRDTADSARTTERLEHPWRLRVGAGVHAGELAESVSDAREATVQLRRRVLGLSD